MAKSEELLEWTRGVSGVNLSGARGPLHSLGP